MEDDHDGFDSAAEAGIGSVSVGRRRFIGNSNVPVDEWKRDALIRVPRVTRDALKLLAAIHRKAMNVLLVEIVDEYVSRRRHNKGFGDVFEEFIVEEEFKIEGDK